MIEQANETLRAKGYSPSQLAVHPVPLPGKALLKGSKIVSPFSDSVETIARVVEEHVPTLEELGRRVLTPRELRERLGSG